MTPFDYALRLALGVVPVLAFLQALALLDTYRLVSFRKILRAVAWGTVAACLCYIINTGLSSDARIGAPIIEELLTAGYVLWLIQTCQIGFMVDAAIVGVAAGAGFALIENVADLELLGQTSLAVWTLRGFGTAMMHAGTTAIVGVSSVALLSRGFNRLTAFLPGLLAAILIHIAWNRAILTPLEASIAMLLGLPILFTLVFIRSEKSLRQWMGHKLDQDIELLGMISRGRFLDETHAGHYLKTLRDLLPPRVVGDMLCLLQISLQLSVRAKGNLIRREAGLIVERDPSLDAQFRELQFLERSIGIAGRRALEPLLPFASRDLWEMHRLREPE